LLFLCRVPPLAVSQLLAFCGSTAARAAHAPVRYRHVLSQRTSTGWDTGVVAKYHKRFPLSETALKTLERRLKTPLSPQALEGLVRFLESNEIWTPEIDVSLKVIASSTADKGYVQVTALKLLVKHSINSDLIVGIAHTGANQDLRNYAFGVLIEQQHRPSIEGALARLTDDELKAGNVSIPDTSPLGWLVKIKE
jgi:hypothetical protein